MRKVTLGVYIQVPFCQAKCTYCNFHTGVFARNLYAPYVDAVCRELANHEALYRAAGLAPPAMLSSGHGLSRAEESSPVMGASTLEEPPVNWSCLIVDTLYVGGGTPSLLEPVALRRILDTLRDAFTCRLEEITLEADPETVTAEVAAAWRASGFNRVSLGVQSFNDAELKAAGRMHRRADIFTATRVLRAAGFGNLSFDLIAGLPHQTAGSWEDSLDNLLRLRPEHVSVYLMEIDEGSRLGREALTGGRRYSAAALPDEDAMAVFYERACERLAAAGYEHYEISNWALAGDTSGHNFSRAELQPGRPKASAPEGRFRARHNLKYWRREPYLGFGAGAHSFNGRERWANPHEPAAYVAAIQAGRLPAEQREVLTPQQALEEELFLGLRQLEGIDVARIERQYNASLNSRIESLRAQGLVEFDGRWLRLAPARLTVANEVFVELLG